MAKYNMDKEFYVGTHCYVSEDHYIVEVEDDEELEELHNDNRDVEDISVRIPDDVIDAIIDRHYALLKKESL